MNRLFKRYSGNPILTVKDWPYFANTVFNPGAAMYKGKFLLLCRVEDRKGFSHLTKAVSDDGISNWMIDKKPTFIADPKNYQEEAWGIEDPRITWVEEFKKYCIVYTAYSKEGAEVSMAFTEDFEKFERIGSILPPEDKDAALFPHKINGKWMLIHRPVHITHEQEAHIWVSYSKDIVNWGHRKKLILARKGGWWDANKIGLNAPPLATKDGWLILYHGVKQTSGGVIYRLGLALLDMNQPENVLHRSEEWIFGPQTEYERIGDVNNIVFPCGWVHDVKTGEVKIYYGAADSCIGLATADLNDLLEYIKNCPKG